MVCVSTETHSSNPIHVRSSLMRKVNACGLTRLAFVLALIAGYPLTNSLVYGPTFGKTQYRTFRYLTHVNINTAFGLWTFLLMMFIFRVLVCVFVGESKGWRLCIKRENGYCWFLCRNSTNHFFSFSCFTSHTRSRRERYTLIILS